VQACEPPRSGLSRKSRWPLALSQLLPARLARAYRGGQASRTEAGLGRAGAAGTAERSQRALVARLRIRQLHRPRRFRILAIVDDFTHYSAPGKPQQNAFAESFIGRLRDESSSTRYHLPIIIDFESQSFFTRLPDSRRLAWALLGRTITRFLPYLSTRSARFYCCRKRHSHPRRHHYE
jgi:transposase InsO family protein